MPTVKLTTTKEFAPAKRKELALALLETTASVLGKPAAFTQTIVDDGKTVAFGGNAELDSAFIAVMAIGELKRDACARLSGAFCALLEKEGIPANRTYICFNSRKGEEWGYDSSLFG